MKIELNKYKHRHPNHTHILISEDGLIVLAGDKEQVERVKNYIESLIQGHEFQLRFGDGE